MTPKWDVVQALGAISLITSDQKDAFGGIRADFIEYTEGMLARQSESPYLISMEAFAWGSNSDVGNDGMLKIIAYDLTGTKGTSGLPKTTWITSSDGTPRDTALSPVLGANRL